MVPQLQVTSTSVANSSPENNSFSGPEGGALDLFFPDTARHPYYVVAPGYTRYSAGIKVLHTLCHILNLRGQSAFLLTSHTHPDLISPRLTDDVVEAHFAARRTPIVIYPERLVGNPLNAGCVVRYLLNIPGLLGIDPEFGSEDIFVWYAEVYRRQCNGTEPILEIPTSDARIFSPPAGNEDRSGSCFYAGKFRLFSGEELLPVTRDSVEIPYGGDGASQHELADLFRRSEIFYTYEHTALALEATLCGCPSVILTSNFTRRPADEVRKWPGIGWGTDPEEVEWAKQTVHEARDHYEQLAATALRQLDDFIEMTQEIAAERPYTKRINLADPHHPPAVLPPRPRFRRRCKNAVKAALHALK